MCVCSEIQRRKLEASLNKGYAVSVLVLVYGWHRSKGTCLAAPNRKLPVALPGSTLSPVTRALEVVYRVGVAAQKSH